MQEKTRDQHLHGDYGEDAAAAYLEKRGFDIVARKFRIKGGEIDIIAVRNKHVYFVEVKTRGSGSIIDPVEAVTPAKIKRIRKTAEYFLLKHPVYEQYPCSFAVVGIDLAHIPPTIECILDAFE